MATHSLHHKIDEVEDLLKSIEETTKRAKALLYQSTKKKVRREEVKRFSLSEALREKEPIIEHQFEDKEKAIVVYKESHFSIKDIEKKLKNIHGHLEIIRSCESMR